MPECPDLKKCQLHLERERFTKYCVSLKFKECWYYKESRVKRQTPSEWQREIDG